MTWKQTALRADLENTNKRAPVFQRRPLLYILSADSQHAGPQLPRVMFPLSLTPVWILLSWSIVKPSSLSGSAKNWSWSQPQSEFEMSLQAAAWLPAPVSSGRAGVPWALVSLSWSWAAHGGAASCPGNTSRVCPVKAAPRSPPRRSLDRQKRKETSQLQSRHVKPHALVIQRQTTPPQDSHQESSLMYTVRLLTTSGLQRCKHEMQ